MPLRITPADCQISAPIPMQKTASYLTDLFSYNFPSLASGISAYNQSRAVQRAIDAQREAELYPALHATQPDIWMAQQQAMFGGAGFSPPTPTGHHHRRHRRHLG